MFFSEYLKSCREQANLTQEELVHALYDYDIENFESLDANSLSKWERAITHPKALKKVQVIKYFQKLTGLALPCLAYDSIKNVETLICKAGVRNLTGNSNDFILKFPSESMHIEDFVLHPARDSERMDTLMSLNMDVHLSTNSPYSQISQEQFKSWALHPSNFFILCEYKDVFSGLFFTLRLKPEVFEKLMHFQMKKSEITHDDFASHDEVACNYLLSFYALNQKVATLLIIRYYAHLIANQKSITHVGVTTSNEDVKRVVKKMNLEEQDHHKIEEETLYAYQATLANILASENFVNMILTKQECP